MEVGERLHFALSADTLFDQYPNILPAALNPTGMDRSEASSPYGFDGRFFYAHANYHWQYSCNVVVCHRTGRLRPRRCAG